jgi:transposase
MARRRTLTLTDEERNELIEQRDHHPSPQVRERCAALLKIAAGASPHRVAKQGLLKERDPDTVYEWLNRYETDGLEAVLTRKQGGDRRSGL